jgi:putative phosphoribosyl transferase
MSAYARVPQPVLIPLGHIVLNGDLRVPRHAVGLVIFAHGSGSSRHSARNRFVAEELGRHGFATLMLDLLTAEEAPIDDVTAQYRFDIPRLGQRVTGAIDWAVMRPDLRHLPLGLFGASTGAAAALVAAAARPALVRAVVSRGGRPDLAADALPRVKAPSLLLVGGDDREVIGLNEVAAEAMSAPVEIEVVPGATHLFVEAGTLERVARSAAAWFERFVAGRAHVRAEGTGQRAEV